MWQGFIKPLNRLVESVVIIDAFETFYKRCKALKDYLSNLPNPEETYHFCTSNSHFLKVFEQLLYNLVKSGEITEKFDSLNKSTAFKIEKFIKDYINREIQIKESDSSLKTSLKEFDIEFKRISKEVRDKQTKLRQEFMEELENSCI